MSQLNFDATTVAPNTGSPDPVPAGWYHAMIDESEMKPTKDNLGQYLEIRLNIIDGQFAGRKVYDRLNLINNNATAQEIGNGTLSAICHATGVLQLHDSQQLHGQPMQIKVKLKAAEGDYEASNNISSYKSMNEQVGTPGAMPQSPAPAQAAAPQGQPVQPIQPIQQPVAQPIQQPVAPTGVQNTQPPAQQVQQPAPAPVAQPAAQPETVAPAPVANGAPPPWVAQQQQQQ